MDRLEGRGRSRQSTIRFLWEQEAGAPNSMSCMGLLSCCRDQGVCSHIYRHAHEVLGLMNCGISVYILNASNYCCLCSCCELDAGVNGRRVEALSSSHPMLEITFAVSGGIRTFACMPFRLRQVDPPRICGFFTRCYGGKEQSQLLSLASAWRRN